MAKQEFWQECTDKWRAAIAGWYYRGGDSFYCYMKHHNKIVPTQVDLMCDTITNDGLVSCTLEKLGIETDGESTVLRFVLLPELVAVEALHSTGRDLGGLASKQCSIRFKARFMFSEDTHDHIARQAEEEAKKLFDNAVKKYSLTPFEDVEELLCSIIAEIIFYSNAPVGE